MARIGLCGGTWQAESLNIDAERTINLYPKQNPPDAVSAFSLINTPGTKAFTSGLPGAMNRGQFFYLNASRHFTVSGAQFSEVLNTGAAINRGVVVDDGLPASIWANNANQLFITSGGKAYCFNLTSNVLTTIDTSGGPALQAPVLMGAFCDGYFLALLNDGRFQVSNLEDGLTWSPSQIARPSVFSENAIALFVDHREVFLIGPSRGVVYWDSGNTFPFDPAPGANIQQGIAGTWAWATLDNTKFALMADENGSPIAVRFEGYRPQRISHDGIEYTLSQLGTASQATCYAYQEAGHTFFAVQLPNASTTLFYDVASGLWHERAYMSPITGSYLPHRSRNHAFAFGKHLVGDTQSGNLYQMSLPVQAGSAWTFCDDDGNPKVWKRRTPHICNEREWMFHHQIEIHMETGLGPIPPLLGGVPAGPYSIVLQDSLSGLWQLIIGDDGIIVVTSVASGTPQTLILNDVSALTSWKLSVTAGILSHSAVTYSSAYAQIFDMATPGSLQGTITITNGSLQTQAVSVPRDPQIMLQWYDDGGHVPSNQRILNCGQAGKFNTRVVARRLGRSRDRVYEISGSDAVPIRIMDAYLKADGPDGFGVQERLVAKLRKQA